MNNFGTTINLCHSFSKKHFILKRFYRLVLIRSFIKCLIFFSFQQVFDVLSLILFDCWVQKAIKKLHFVVVSHCIISTTSLLFRTIKRR